MLDENLKKKWKNERRKSKGD